MDDLIECTLQQQFDQLLCEIKTRYSNDEISKYNELAYQAIDNNENSVYITYSSSYGD
ncbi:MAG: hypothetical protein II990_01045 [Muribaculaceae bacterium]|nr:hypothetical protein [Muribaculaceae bacterium]